MNYKVESDFGCWIPWMRRAIQLASLADGFTSPNPLVGAIVLSNEGKLVGEGYHCRAGQDHAEVKALLQAGEKAINGTLIVSLEPCCHYGRTPPCTDAILNSGIGRVVIGLKDPDKRVSGRGIVLLREAGVEVITGVLEKEVASQNKEFIFQVQTGRPWGILKCAMTLDGRIGLPNGESKWISGSKSREIVHHLRSRCDAVIVGGGTIRSDNPLLTSRGLSNPEPLRVVLTNTFNFPKESQIFDLNIAKTIIAYGPDADEKIISHFSKGPELMPLKSSDPIELAKKLSKKGCNRVLWECGPKLSTNAIKQSCVQELLVVLAPKLLGGISAMTLFDDFGFVNMSEALAMKNLFIQKKGSDYHLRMLIDKQDFLE